MKKPYLTLAAIVIISVSLFNSAFAVTKVNSSFQGMGNPLTNNLVGWFTFDGNNVPNGVINDVSGNSNNGNPTNISTSTFYMAGKIGQGITLDGVNDSITTTNFADNPTNLSVSLWYKTTAVGAVVPNRRMVLVGKMANSGNGAGWQMRQQDSNDVNPNSIDILTQNAGGSAWQQRYTTGAAFNNGRWHHIVWTAANANSNTVTDLVYVDGVSQSLSSSLSGAGSYSTITTATKVILGRDGDSNATTFFNGALDDVRIYTRILSQAEITQLYLQSNYTHKSTYGKAVYKSTI